MECLFNKSYKNKTVLVTGHTGFKGSWLCYWLIKMGANVIGYSRDVPTIPNHVSLLDLDMTSIIGDVGNLEQLNHTFQTHKPDIVFHLAAQSLVKFSYENPIETYMTNVIGTLKVFEACRNVNVKAVVNVTSDKSYENKEWVWGYRENDPMGGYDPYSASKGCADLLTNSYRSSYFNTLYYKKRHNTLLASCRAGNVIGGGDWAENRLLVDTMIAASRHEKVIIRNPNATRPWQHVLEPLSGYLLVGQKLLEEKTEYADAWNFGPSDEENMTVEKVVANMKKYWSKVDYAVNENREQSHEANLLKLDCSKAHALLGWSDVWDSRTTFEKTAKWYKAYYEENSITLTRKDLDSYVIDARKKGLVWTRN